MFIKSLLIFSSILLVSCATTSIDFQSAKILPEGEVDITPSYSTTLLDHELGVEMGYGLSKDFEVRGGVHTFFANHGESESSIFYYESEKNAFIKTGIKYSLIDDYFSLYLPVAYDVYNFDETVSIQPSILLTKVFPTNHEINFQFKEMIYVNAESPYVIHALNVGIGYKIGESITLRPVGNVLYFYHSDGGVFFFKAGMGVTIKI